MAHTLKNAATARMIEDVSKLVVEGRAVPTRPGTLQLDEKTRVELLRMGRFVNRNKRKIFISTAALVVAGVLTGGAAVGVAIVAKAGSFIAGRVYRALELWHSEKKITRLFPDMVDGDTGLFKAEEFAITPDGSPNKNFGECISAVQTIISHRDFSNMVNAFVDATNSYELFNTQRMAAVQVTTCAQSIRVLTDLYRFKYHYTRLEPAFNFLDQYVLYIFLTSMTMEAEFGERVKSVWTRLANIPDPLGYLNTIANSSDVLHTRGFFGGEENHRAWVKAALDPYVSLTDWVSVYKQGGSENSVQMDKRGFVAGVRDGAAGAATGYTAFTASGGKLASESLKKVSNIELKPDLQLSIETAGAEIAANIVAEFANAKWNAAQLKSGRTLGMSGWRDLTLEERVTLMKTKVKSSLTRINTKYEHWVISHDNFMKSSTLEDQCKFMLRSRKHWAQTVGSTDWQDIVSFHEFVITKTLVANNTIFRSEHDAARMKEFFDQGSDFGGYENRGDEPWTKDDAKGEGVSALDKVHMSIDNHIGSHVNGACSDISFCYMPIGLHLKQTHADGPQQPNLDPTYPLFAMSDSSKVVSIMQ